MNAIAQMQASPLLASYLTFVATTAGLYPYDFKGDNCINFATLAGEAPTHACLYVPHLGYGRSPIYRRFFDVDGSQLEGTGAKRYASSSLTTFATEFVRLQNIINDALKLRETMTDPYAQVPHAVKKHLKDDRSPDTLVYSAVLLSSIYQRVDCVESPARLFLSSACQVVNKDAKALIAELAYAARKKCASEHRSTCPSNHERLLHYADKMTMAWYNALISMTKDPAYKTERIFAGMRACFASEIHLHSLALFLEQLYLLRLNPSIEDDLRIALAKLVFAEYNNKNRRDVLRVAVQKIRNAKSQWERKPERLEHMPAIRQMLQQIEHTSPEQTQVG